nr:reverse transcriptase domain-containing protein [Tanacetum cinerariifolium]
MTGGLSRGSPRDHIGSTPASIVGSTSGGPLEVIVETPRTEATPSAREHIKGDPTEITKIVRKANETLIAFKGRWIVETGFITGVPEVMKISSFMDAHKCPELAKRFFDKVPKIVDEMMTRLDDFVSSKEAFASTATVELTAAKADATPTHKGNPRQGASVEVMFERCFENLSPAIRSRLRDTRMDLVGLTGSVVKPLGKIELKVVFGDGDLFRMVMITFIVVREPSPYNVIFGRTGLRSLRAVSSTIHSMVKFPTPRGVATLVTHSAIIFECRILERKQTIGQDDRQNANPERVDLTEQTLVNPAYLDQLDITKENKDEYQWTENAERAFQEIKKIIAELPLLTTPVKEETLYVYLTAATKVVLADFLSKAPVGTPSEEFFRLLAKWSRNDDMERWTLFTDGALNSKGSEAGLILISPSGVEFTYALRLNFASTNNEVRGLTCRPPRGKKDEGSKHRRKEGSRGDRGGRRRQLDDAIIRCLADGVWPINKDKKRALKMKLNQRSTYDHTECTSAQGARSGSETSQNVNDFNHGSVVILPMRNGHPRSSTAIHWKIKANSLVERANKSLMKGIKARLGRERAGWIDELPNILWAHRTSLNQCNGETPFSLTYGSKDMIRAEIRMPTHRTMMIREDGNEDELHLNMDLLQERREAAAIREAKYKTKMEQYYNQKVRQTSFKLNEYVFQRNKASRVEDQGKVGPRWEGPYRVTEAYQNGSYKLQTMEGKEVPRTWHVINLQKCYV